MVQTWTAQQVQELPPLQTSLTDWTVVGSYNWGSDDCVVIPGAPRRWASPPGPVRLPRENKGRVRARFQEKHLALEPLVRAVAACTPDFPFPAVDVVLDRNLLRLLYQFCTQSPSRQDFRAALTLRGGTVLVTRRARRGFPVYAGYGGPFEDRFTEPLDSAIDGSHRRVSVCSLAGLRVLLRFEVDAIRAPPEPESQSHAEDGDAGRAPPAAAQAANRPAEAAPEAAAGAAAAGMRVRYAGRFDGASATVELKTKARGYAHEFDYASAWAQTLLGNDAALAIGFHSTGYVERATVLSREDLERKVGPRGPEGLARTARLLVEICGLARRTLRGADAQELVLDCNGRALTASVGAAASPALPAELARLFDGEAGARPA